MERKIGELVRRHGARRARYWGQLRVLLQQLLPGLVVNIQRVVNLIVAPDRAGGGIVCAVGLQKGLKTPAQRKWDKLDQPSSLQRRPTREMPPP